MKKYLFLLILIFTNGISSSYSKRFDPVHYSYSQNEYGKVKPVTLGKEVDSFSKNGEIVVQFENVLEGKGRIISYRINHDEKKYKITEADPSSKEKRISFLLYRVGLNLFDENKKIPERNLISVGINKEDIRDEIVLIFMSELSSRIQYVIIERKKTDPEIFEKNFMPRTVQLYSDDLKWVVRDTPTYYFKNTLYYLGFIITVPLDIITSPIQLIGGAYILFSGGFVK